MSGLHRYHLTAMLLACVQLAIGQPGGVCPPLPITLTGNTSYCIGTPAASVGVQQNYAAYQWLPGQETTQNVQLTAGNYEVIITHYTGCQDTLDFEVTQVSNPPQPVITPSGPTTFCEGESVILSASPGYPFYTWNSGSVTQDVEIFESGTYVVSIADWIGCESSSNSVEVTVDPLPVAAFSGDLVGFDITFNNLSENASDYEWNFGDGNGSADFEPSYTYTTGGPTIIWLAASNGCGSDTVFTQFYNVSVNEPEMNPTFDAYPNPSNDVLSIRTASLSDDCTVQLFNFVGQLVYSQEFSHGNGISEMVLSVSDLPPGYYLIEMSTAEAVSSQKILIQH